MSNFKFNSAACELDISGSEQVSLTRSMDSDVEAQNTPVVGPCWDDSSNKRGEPNNPFSTLPVKDGKQRGKGVRARRKSRASMTVVKSDREDVIG